MSSFGTATFRLPVAGANIRSDSRTRADVIRAFVSTYRGSRRGDSDTIHWSVSPASQYTVEPATIAVENGVVQLLQDWIPVLSLPVRVQPHRIELGSADSLAHHNGGAVMQDATAQCSFSFFFKDGPHSYIKHRILLNLYSGIDKVWLVESLGRIMHHHDTVQHSLKLQETARQWLSQVIAASPDASRLSTAASDARQPSPSSSLESSVDASSASESGCEGAGDIAELSDDSDFASPTSAGHRRLDDEEAEIGPTQLDSLSLRVPDSHAEVPFRPPFQQSPGDMTRNPFKDVFTTFHDNNVLYHRHGSKYTFPHNMTSSSPQPAASFRMAPAAPSVPQPEPLLHDDMRDVFAQFVLPKQRRQAPQSTLLGSQRHPSALSTSHPLLTVSPSPSRAYAGFDDGDELIRSWERVDRTPTFTSPLRRSHGKHPTSYYRRWCRWCRRLLTDDHESAVHEATCSLRILCCPGCGAELEACVLKSHLSESRPCRIADISVAAERSPLSRRRVTTSAMPDDEPQQHKHLAALRRAYRLLSSLAGDRGLGLDMDNKALKVSTAALYHHPLSVTPTPTAVQRNPPQSRISSGPSSTPHGVTPLFNQEGVTRRKDDDVRTHNVKEAVNELACSPKPPVPRSNTSSRNLTSSSSDTSSSPESLSEASNDDDERDFNPKPAAGGRLTPLELPSPVRSGAVIGEATKPIRVPVSRPVVGMQRQTSTSTPKSDVMRDHVQLSVPMEHSSTGKQQQQQRYVAPSPRSGSSRSVTSAETSVGSGAAGGPVRQQCKWCRDALRDPESSLRQHEASCQWRKMRCKKCGTLVLLSGRQLHRSECRGRLLIDEKAKRQPRVSFHHQS